VKYSILYSLDGSLKQDKLARFQKLQSNALLDNGNIGETNYPHIILIILQRVTPLSE
jgi:hypothetical protein